MVLDLEERVEPKRAALLVIDVQNAFTQENGSMVRAYQKIGIDVWHIRNMVPRLRNFIDQARSYGVPVIFIRTTFNKWNHSRTWKESHEVRFGEFDESHLLEGSWDSDFYGVAPQAEDCLVTKHRISAFFGTDLDLILRSKGIDSLVLTGCITGGCVEATALEAWMRDYYVTFVEDCCGAYTPEDHQAALDRWKQRAMISSSDAIATAWQQQPRFFPAKTTLPIEIPFPEKVSLKSAAVLVIDIQNDFFHPSGSEEKAGESAADLRSMLPNLKAFLEQARALKVPVLFIKTTHSQWTDSPSWIGRFRASGRKVDVMSHCRDGSWGTEFYDIGPQDDEPVVVKHRYSAFIDTELEMLLRCMGIKTLVITGVGTSVCVESTARDAYMKDFNIMFLEDCTAGTPATRKSTLAVIARNFGTVTSSQEVLKAWEEEQKAKGEKLASPRR